MEVDEGPDRPNTSARPLKGGFCGYATSSKIMYICSGYEIVLDHIPTDGTKKGNTLKHI